MYFSVILNYSNFECRKFVWQYYKVGFRDTSIIALRLLLIRFQL